jgi:RNA polymerase sigma-70 factor, ECF subfamily
VEKIDSPSGKGDALRPPAADSPDNGESAFREFYFRTVPFVQRYVIRRIQGDVDDVVESVFVTAWQRADKIPQVHDDQLVWLYAIARRKIANLVRLRRRRDRFNFSTDYRSDVDYADTERGATEAVAIVHAALARMSPSKREILLLIEWDGLSVDQAARILDISPSAAGKRLWAARSTFRSLCEGHIGDNLT